MRYKSFCDRIIFVMNEKKGGKLNFKRGVKDGLPIGLGYLSVSFAFGVQASLLGLPVLLTVLISATNLTSAGQLAGLPIIACATTGAFLSLVLEMVLAQLVINARYFLMSLTLSQKLDENFTTGKRFFCSIFITDEIFAVSASHPKINFKYMLGIAVLPYLGWTLGTALGAIAGNILPDFISNALGIALYAMFIAIIVPPAIKSKGIIIVILASALISSALYFIPVINSIPQGFKVIISAVISAVIVAVIFPVKEGENDLS